MPDQSSHLTDRLRRELQLNPRLGAGNFLHHAYAINAMRDAPIVFTQEPVSVAGEAATDAFSIAQLKRLSDGYAAWYLAQGVTRMDPIGIYFADGIHYLLHYTALTSIGAIPVLTNGAMDPAMAMGHFRRVGAVAIVTDRARYDRLTAAQGDVALHFVVCIEDLPLGDAAALPAWFPYRHDEDDPVMITHSSGTTGTPKPVMLQHGPWFFGIRHLLGLKAPEGADSYLSSLPSSHNAAVAYAIHAILNGAKLLVMSDRGGAAVAAAIERFRPGTVVSFPQTFVELAELDPAAHDFDSVALWINSGDAAHETHIRRLVARGHDDRAGERVAGSKFVDSLGSSEMGHASFRIVHTASTDTYKRCVGFPQSWVKAAVLDAAGHPVASGTVGLLGVRSNSVTPGYWNDAVLTCRSKLGGYWLTGDLVYQDPMGCFYHVDRVSDTIPTGDGPLYSLETEEAILAENQTLSDCTVIGVPTGAGDAQIPVVVAVPRDGARTDRKKLLAAINRSQAARGRPGVARVEIARGEEIPLGVTGKVLKRVMRERFSVERVAGQAGG